MAGGTALYKLNKGSTLEWDVALTNEDDGTPVDATGWTAEIYDVEVLESITIAPVDLAAGTWFVTMPHTVSAALPRGTQGKFALRFVTALGTVATTMQVDIQIQ